MAYRRRRLATPRSCAPWVPTTDPNALTIENLERRAVARETIAAGREAVVAAALASHPEVADETVNIIVFAWPYLSQAQRAHLLTLALTPEVRGAVAARRAW